MFAGRGPSPKPCNQDLASKTPIPKGIMENQMETTIVYWGNIGIMENQMETTIVYWGNIGIMENKMEATIVSALW